MQLIRPVEVLCRKSGITRHVEGDLRKAVALQVSEDRRRLEEEAKKLAASGRNRSLREYNFTHPCESDNSRKGEDRSWKYNRSKPLGRTLCKRQRRKARYH